MNMNLSKLQDIVEDRRAWHGAVHEVTELDRTYNYEVHLNVYYVKNSHNDTCFIFSVKLIL